MPEGKTIELWVLIHAMFSKKVTERKKIYDCLEKLWNKVENEGTDLSTTWISKTKRAGLSAAFIKAAAIVDFMKCVPKGVQVKLVIHVGATRPSVHVTINKPKK